MTRLLAARVTPQEFWARLKRMRRDAETFRLYCAPHLADDIVKLCDQAEALYRDNQRLRKAARRKRPWPRSLCSF